jgi:fumarate hydratase class II
LIMKTRIESDSMGELAVPANALYGPQTQRAINNFTVSGQPMPISFVRALVKLKAAAATANAQLELIEQDIADAINEACKDLLSSPDLENHFPVDVYQTGSGTSSNMNANEVIATLASRIRNEPVSPNDHVNYGQSSNDVIPTTIHLCAALALHEDLIPALDKLKREIEIKAAGVQQYIKTGRTHLMDAMPVTMGQVLMGWAAQVDANLANLRAIQPAIQTLAQGGTAVGTGVNAHPEFSMMVCRILTYETGIEFVPAKSFFAHIGSQDTAVALSGVLKTIAVTVMKISNDLRWMNSGPLAGLGEISLEALQPGSSIMPGKVNPVIPESAAMVAAQVIGNDAAITIGGQSGNFELNVMLPMIASNLITSIELLSNISPLLAERAIKTFEVNEGNLVSSLRRNPILVTALNPIIGYMKAAEIAKQAYKEDRPIIDVAAEMTDIPHSELEELLDPRRLTGAH